MKQNEIDSYLWSTRKRYRQKRKKIRDPWDTVACALYLDCTYSRSSIGHVNRHFAYREKKKSRMHESVMNKLRNRWIDACERVWWLIARGLNRGTDRSIVIELVCALELGV